MSSSEFLKPAPLEYRWPQCPEADTFLRERLVQFLSGHSFAHRLSDRMQRDTNTEFFAWVDHIILAKRSVSETELARLGFVSMKKAPSVNGTQVYWHPYADLPRVVLSSVEATVSCAIMVDTISEFLLAHALSYTVVGAPCSKYRECRIPGERGNLVIVEQRGTRSLVPDVSHRAGKYLEVLERWTHRRRHFSSNVEGMKDTLKLAKNITKALGTGMASWAFLEGERRYWQSRNRAAQVQKARQDKLGLGWGNHDHHTFRSSRPAFPMLMQILLTLGFKKRERYYAGAESGWGAQVMEQPESRLIIFADVDLTPDEIAVDFTVKSLPELAKPGTIGLWCALHGESMLDAGMHHLEAKFEYETLRHSLNECGISFMKPFTDFPHLRQAFSEGEQWPVAEKRLDQLLAMGRISRDAHEKFRQFGAVGSHLENLQRRNGFKGFNQRGVSDIIRDVNPEIQAQKRARGEAP